MDIGDKVYWYDISWMGNSLSVHLFSGTITNEVGLSLWECTPNPGNPRAVSCQLVQTTIAEAKKAATAWIETEKRARMKQYNAVLRDLK